MYTTHFMFLAYVIQRLTLMMRMYSLMLLERSISLRMQLIGGCAGSSGVGADGTRSGWLSSDGSTLTAAVGTIQTNE